MSHVNSDTEDTRVSGRLTVVELGLRVAGELELRVTGAGKLQRPVPSAHVGNGGGIEEFQN